MKTNRRWFLKSTLGAGLALATSGCGQAGKSPNITRPVRSADGPEEIPIRGVNSPVIIASVELLRSDKFYFVRTRSTDGATGIAIATNRARYLYPMLQQLVAPAFIGQDARRLSAIVDGICLKEYKLLSLALCSCIGWVESSVLDLVGKAAKKPLGELFGDVIRSEIPVYLSSMRRDTTAEAELEWVAKRLADTGGKAVKLKIGGRMSRNADAYPHRTETLIPLARKTFGDDITIYVDANGSYDDRKAIEVGKFLQGYNVAFFEEPCPYTEFEQTRRVADALSIPVAGGEQDFSPAMFNWMIQNRGLDIVQPDIHYNGGFVRTIRVGKMAAKAKMSVILHSSKYGFESVYMAHFASITPNIGEFQEYNAAPHKPQTWCKPQLEVKNGLLKVPTGPGLGLKIDPAVLTGARILG